MAEYTEDIEIHRTARIKSKIVEYDVLDRNRYPKGRREYIYLGYGTIHTLNHVLQTGKTKYHFFKRG